jgi:DNA/RNA endonuclease G (NUC1)
MTYGFRALAVLALALSTIAAWSPAWAANCTAAERAVADRALRLTPAQKQAAIRTHLPWGAPQPVGPVTRERQLVQNDYVIGYDGDLRVPLWAAERVDSARLQRITREDCFRADPRLPTAEASTPRDYDEPIYDQGHIAPFANQTSSAVAGHNSFIMSNMAPQTCQTNRGIWQILEGIVRLWAAEHGTVFVLSGSIFDRDGNRSRDADSAAPRMAARNGTSRVAVPSHFYKVIALERPDGSVSTVSFILPHGTDNPDGDAARRYLEAHVARIADIERVIGTDLFPQQVRLAESATLWPFQGRQPRSLCNIGRTN